MNYASFGDEPSKNNERLKRIQQIVNESGYTQLYSNLSDRSFFYFDKINKLLLQVQEDGDEEPIFYTPSPEISKHISVLNNI